MPGNPSDTETMMLYQIKSHFDGRVLFELECASLKLCAEAAVTAHAYLRGTDLRGANLRGTYLRAADLRAADLRGADLGGHKVDGDYGLILAGTPDNWGAMGFVDAASGELRVIVGCRHKSIAEGRAYWSNPDHHYLAERREVLAALDYIEAVARLRGWSPKAEG